MSKAIVHLSLRKELQSNVFHVVGPHYIPAKDLFQIINSLGYAIGFVAYDDWRDALIEGAKTSSANALYPLLAGFIDGPPLELPAFDCRQTLEGLRGTQVVCPAIDRDLMTTYLRYFKDSGFLANT